MEARSANRPPRTLQVAQRLPSSPATRAFAHMKWWQVRLSVCAVISHAPDQHFAAALKIGEPVPAVIRGKAAQVSLLQVPGTNADPEQASCSEALERA